VSELGKTYSNLDFNTTKGMTAYNNFRTANNLFSMETLTQAYPQDVAEKYYKDELAKIAAKE
jgi:hypothetical protein